MARIVYWPLSDFDTIYALRVIEFHEDFHVPLFWLSPEHLLGKNDKPRKQIGSIVLCEHTPSKKLLTPKWDLNDIHGSANIQESDFYPKWEGFMRAIGKASYYNEIELPILMERGVIQDVIEGF
jgi:hypothetical protein